MFINRASGVNNKTNTHEFISLAQTQSVINALILLLGIGLGFTLLLFINQYPAHHLPRHHHIGATVFAVSLMISNGLILLRDYMHLRGITTHTNRQLAQAAICILIAGSYTPLILLTHTSHLMVWGLIAAIWLLAAMSCLQQQFKRLDYDWLNTLIFIAFGWLGLFTLGHLVGIISSAALVWVIIGCVICIAGTSIFSCDRRPFFNSLWYLSLLAASLCQTYVIVYYIL